MSWLDDIFVVQPFGELGYSRYHMALQTNPDYGRIITNKRILAQQGSYPHQAANDLFRSALQIKGWKRLLIMEHDHEYPHDVFRRHAHYKEPIVGGVYVLRDSNSPLPVLFNWDAGRHNALRPPASVMKRMLEKPDIYPIDCVPLGCTSIAREVLEGWPKEQPFFSSYTNPQGATISHDVFFCRVAQDNGFQSYVDTGLRVDHYSLVKLNVGYFIRWWNEIGAGAAVEEAQRYLKVVPPAKPDQSKPVVVVAHTKDGLKEETKSAVEASGLGVTYVEMLKEESYYLTFAACWDQGETFISVEQDVVPQPGALQEMLDCPEPWCCYAFEDYPPIGYYEPATSCGKFSQELIAALPDAMQEIGKWSDPKHPPMHWCRVDGWLKQYLMDHGAKLHVHGTVTHLSSGKPGHDCISEEEAVEIRAYNQALAARA